MSVISGALAVLISEGRGRNVRSFDETERLEMGPYLGHSYLLFWMLSVATTVG